MVVCKYFQEGCCRFGNNCKFEHVKQYGGYMDPGQLGGRSILKSESQASVFGGQRYDQGFMQGSSVQSSGFGQSPVAQSNSILHSSTQSNSFLQTTPQNNRFMQGNPVYQQREAAPVSPGMRYNVHEIMNLVLKDVQQVERGGQWQLSAYSPLRDLANIPALEDYSPEELRWQTYKAVQTSTFPLWQAMVQQLYANVEKVHNELKKKETGYAIIDKWLREGQVVQGTQVNQSPFGGGSFSTPFSTAPAASQPFSSGGAGAGGGTSPFTFSLSQQQAPAVFPTTVSVFESGQPPPPPFSHPAATAPLTDINAYSKIEELSEQEIAAFKADRFTLGTIPTKPPPQLFCDV